MTKQININFDKPDDYNISMSEAVFQDGTAVIHKDYCYKNEISVMSNGKTRTYDVPNVSALFFMGLDIMLSVLLISELILSLSGMNLERKLPVKKE